jgi:hypothetical protein
MRYPIKISPFWHGLFTAFGFARKRSYAEIDGQALYLHFGTAHERIPLDQISNIARGHWPFYFGLGAKYGPRGGVAYVGSTEGVVQIDFAHPRPMNVWGPFHASHARCVTVSIEEADRFIEDVRGRIPRG